MDERPDTPKLLGRLTSLADLARLRILRLLEREELSVGELARALQLPQSTVSRHLKVLHESEWIVKRTEGTASLYRVVPADLGRPAQELWALAREQMGSSPTLVEDDHRLVEVLAERRSDSRAFFGRVGGEWDHLREELFGGRFTPTAVLGLLPPDWIVADLGCGTGNAAEWIAPYVERVIAVDREQAMLDAARNRLAAYENVEFRPGDLTDLPIDDASVNAAMVFLVLHHLPEPVEAIREMARVLAPGGIALVVDMVAHDREAYRHSMGHLHLGFDHAQLERWASASGLTLVRHRRLPPDTGAKGPGLFVATFARGR